MPPCPWKLWGDINLHLLSPPPVPQRPCPPGLLLCFRRHPHWSISFSAFPSLPVSSCQQVNMLNLCHLKNKQMNTCDRKLSPCCAFPPAVPFLQSDMDTDCSHHTPSPGSVFHSCSSTPEILSRITKDLHSAESKGVGFRWSLPLLGTPSIVLWLDSPPFPQNSCVS